MIAEYEQGVRFTCGHPGRVSNGGVLWCLPFFQQVEVIDTTVGAIIFKPQAITTADKIPVIIRLGLEYHVENALKMLMCLGDNDLEEILSVIGQGLAAGILSKESFENIISHKMEIEDRISEKMNDLSETNGVHCDRVSILECAQAISFRLFK